MLESSAMQHETFFSTVATVIPVLLIALFIQDRFQPDRRGPALLRLAVLPLLLFGELTSVSALIQRKPTALEQDIALAAISAGSWMLISRPLYELLAPVTKHVDFVFDGMLVALLVLSVAFGGNGMPVLGLGLAVVLFVSGYALSTKDLVSAARAEKGEPRDQRNDHPSNGDVDLSAARSSAPPASPPRTKGNGG
jgi:hypothetical protein